MNWLPYNGFNLMKNLTSSNEEINAIGIHGKEYLIYDHMTSDAEAESIYLALTDSHVQQKASQKQESEADSAEPNSSQKQWKKDETLLLQYVIFVELLQQKKSDEELTREDWKRLAVLVPGRTEQQCKKRWLFIQQKSGNKSGWTAQETELLKSISS